MRARITRKKLGAAAFAASLMVATPAVATEVNSFRTAANFNVPDGGVAEIVDATPDGRTLLYTDAGNRTVGVVDISRVSAPTQVALLDMPGEPTSVTVTEDGARAFVAVNTSVKEEGAPPVITPGLLVVIDLASRTIVDEVPIGNGPDSVSAARVGGIDVAVIAIENEPVVVDAAGNLTDDEAPGLPGDISGPGLIQVVAFEASVPRVIDVVLGDLTRVSGLLFADDPQPEFVSIQGTTAAVSLQENNGVAIVDLEKVVAGSEGALERVFAIGRAADRPADLLDDDDVRFAQRYPRDALAEQPNAGIRTPDALALSPDGRIVYTADEGEEDFTGGRGWSAHDVRSGRLIFEETGLEAVAARFGHYPDGRSDAKGIEIEGITTATYGGRDLVFVGSERGSFLAVYDIDDPRAPKLLQILPTGIEPEGILPIPSRNLVVAASEESGNLTILRGGPARPGGTPERPQISSSGPDVPWAALSGLAGDPHRPNVLWSVPDNALPSSLYRIEVKGGNARLTSTPIRVDGERARLDLEGIAIDTSIRAHRAGLERMKKATAPGGFWLANEGNADFGDEGYDANRLVQVDRRGNVLQQITLPEAIDSPTGGVIRSNGFEGVAVSDSGRYLLAAIQREYATDATIGGVRHTRIARYDLLAERWDFFLYPLETTDAEDDWIGLSEIVNLGGDRYAVIERDKLQGGAARVKRVYEFTLDGLIPTDGSPLAGDADVTDRVITKTLLRDVLADTAPFEKVEGLALTKGRTLWAVVDNDGGKHESRLVALGKVARDEGRD